MTPRRRLLNALKRHIDIYREVTYKDLNHIIERAGVTVLDPRSLPPYGARCVRCNRRLRAQVVTIEGAPYGAKCAQIVLGGK